MFACRFGQADTSRIIRMKKRAAAEDWYRLNICH